MVEAVKLPEGAGNLKLAAYMARYLGLIVSASSIFALLAGTPEALEQRRQMWEHLDATDLTIAALKLQEACRLAAGHGLQSPVSAPEPERPAEPLQQ